jgi:hypothetical protein
MQQHISPEWLDELTAEEQDVLRQMWEPKVGDRFTHYWPNENDDLVLVESLILAYTEGKIADGGSIVWHKDASLPLFSIGEMTEILIKHGEKCIGEAYPAMFFRGNEYLSEVAIKWTGMDKGKELARALWEAVKEVIKAKVRGEQAQTGEKVERNWRESGEKL